MHAPCSIFRHGREAADELPCRPCLPDENGAMYSSTFIFAKRRFDDEFHRLDEQIAAAARATPGYLGEEAWENPGNGLVSTVYYWASLDALQTLIEDPTHRAAKSRQSNWLDGYQVVISQVIRTYGDGKLASRLPAPGAAPGEPDVGPRET